MNTFNALKDLALPSMEHYLDDLMVYDKDSIDANPYDDYIHITRTMGTHLFMFSSPQAYYIKRQDGSIDDSMDTKRRLLRNDCEYFTNRLTSTEMVLLHHKTKDGIKVITVDDAVELIEQFRIKTFKLWNAK